MTVQIIRPRTRIAFSYFSISTYSFGLCAMNGSPGPNRMTLVSGSFSARMDASVKKLIPVVFIPDFPADQHFRRLSAHLFRRLPDRGQRNLEKRVHEDVVVSDHGNVFRNMESLLLYPLHGPDRHHIVEREDGIRPVFSYRIFFSLARHGPVTVAPATSPETHRDMCIIQRFEW